MTDWTQAACVGKPPEWWDDESEQAFHHCQACPIMASCLQQALLPEDDGGSWNPGMRGGWTHEQRRYFKRHGKPPRPINWAKMDKREPGKPRLPKGHTLPAEDNNLRFRLYQAGMGDTEIARRVFVSPKAIESWRRHRNLPAIKPVFVGDAERLQAYENGFTDRQAALLLGTSVRAMTQWRLKRKLKVNRASA